MAWRTELDDPAAFDQATLGTAWRLGRDFWTEIDSEVAYRVDGKMLPEGLRFLGVGRTTDGDWTLDILDGRTVRIHRADASAIAEHGSHWQVPLRHETRDVVREELDIELIPSGEQLRLEVLFGRHALVADLEPVRNQARGGITDAGKVACPFTTFGRRGATRIIFFDRTQPRMWNSSVGQVSIEFGEPPWKPAYAQHLGGSLDQDEPTRWRMGEDFWTNLDTRLPLRFGDVEVPVGYYYLVLEIQAPETMSLVLLDPDEVGSMELDGWHVGRRETPDGIEIPLAHEYADDVAKTLAVDLAFDPIDARKGSLKISFGPHRLSADFGLTLAPLERPGS